MVHESRHPLRGSVLPFIIGLLLGLACREVLVAFKGGVDILDEVLTGVPWPASLPYLLHDPKILAISLLCLALICLLAALVVSESRNRRRRGGDKGEEE